jgi:hypothetical protein
VGPSRGCKPRACRLNRAPGNVLIGLDGFEKKMQLPIFKNEEISMTMWSFDLRM